MSFQDPLSIYWANKAQKNQNHATSANLWAQYNIANNNLATAKEQAPLIPREAAESYAERGVGDSTFAQSGTQRAQNLATRMISNANSEQQAAQANLEAWRKNLKYQRWQYYMGQGSNLLNGALSLL